MRLLHCLEIRNFKRFGDTQRIELDRADSDDGGLRISYWRRYECENYVVTPDTLRSFARDRYKDAPPLFEGLGDDIDEVLDTLILERVFEGREDDFAVWKAAGPAAGRLLWVARTERLKLSTFAEDFFRRLAERFGHAMLLRKGAVSTRGLQRFAEHGLDEESFDSNADTYPSAEWPPCVTLVSAPAADRGLRQSWRTAGRTGKHVGAVVAMTGVTTRRLD